MRERFLGNCAPVILALLFIFPAAAIAQRTGNRPAPRPATTTATPNDLKITYRTTIGGQSNQTTTMLKGPRERSEMKLGYGMDMINITQCDLRRTLQISDNAKKYVITPMDAGDSTAPAAAVSGGMSGPVQRGGVITYTSTAIDTGERKEMFGFQARHVKTSMAIESSPDACNQARNRIETDGWYIDFSYGLNCEVGRSAVPMGPQARGGCRDRVNFVRHGAARTGYALIETTTSYGPDGSVAFTSTKEVIELSRAPLDAALFDIPAGYTEASSTQELYAAPSMSSMMAQASQGQAPSQTGQDNPAQSGEAKAPGVIRIGVAQINNKANASVSTDALRQRLINEIQGNGLEAVSLNGISPREAEAEARARQCDFMLFTDLTGLKVSAAKSLGGFLGRATGVGNIGKTEAKVEFKLFAVGEPAVRLASAATAKEEGDEASAGTALSQEARQVSAEAKRKRG